MKTAKIESYRIDFVSYRFAMELIGIESKSVSCIVFSNFKKKEKRKRGV